MDPDCYRGRSGRGRRLLGIDIDDEDYDDDTRRRYPHHTAQVVPWPTHHHTSRRKSDEPSPEEEEVKKYRREEEGIAECLRRIRPAEEADVELKVQKPKNGTWKFYPGDSRAHTGFIDVIDHDHELLVLRRPQLKKFTGLFF